MIPVCPRPLVDEQNMKGVLILMLFVSLVLPFVSRRMAQGDRDIDLHGRCTMVITMLLLIALYYFEQQASIHSTLNSLLDIFVTDRILEDLLPPKNRTFADLLEEVA